MFVQRRRRGATALVATVCALFLAACSGPASTPSPSASTGGQPSSTTSQSATEPAAKPSGTVTWWSWNPSEADAAINIAEFNKEFPDIKVEYKFVEYSNYVNTVRLAATSDSGPDVFGLQVGVMANQFAPLTQDLKPRMEASVGGDYADKLTATDQFTIDGKLVGAPWMVTGAGLMWYNEALIKQHGVEVPATLAELKEACTTLAAAKVTCLAHGAKDNWVNLDVYQAIVNQLAPGKIYQAFKGEASFTDPEFVKAFEIWKSLFDDKIMPQGALGLTQYPDASTAFGSGKAAFVFMGTWQNSYTTTTGLEGMSKEFGDPKIKDFVLMPTFFPEVEAGAKTGALFGGPDIGYAISAKAKNADAAWAFVHWLTATENGQKVIAKTMQQPSLKTIPLDTSNVVNEAQKEALAKQGPALGNMVGAREIPNADIATALGLALQEVASGQKSAADAAKAVDQAVKSAG